MVSRQCSQWYAAKARYPTSIRCWITRPINTWDICNKCDGVFNQKTLETTCPLFTEGQRSSIYIPFDIASITFGNLCRSYWNNVYQWLLNCEVRYSPTLARIEKNVAEDRLPISCRCWNDNSGMDLAANSGPNSGRQHLFFAHHRPDAVPNSGLLTSGMVCRGKSDTWPSNVPSMGQTLTLLLSELDLIVKVTIGLV